MKFDSYQDYVNTPIINEKQSALPVYFYQKIKIGNKSWYTKSCILKTT